MLGNPGRRVTPALFILLTAFIWVYASLLHNEEAKTPQAAEMRPETDPEAGIDHQELPGEYDSDHPDPSFDRGSELNERSSGEALVSVVVKLKGSSSGASTRGTTGMAPMDTKLKGKAMADEGTEESGEIHLDRRFDAFETAVRESIPEAEIIYRFRTETGHVHMRVPIDRLADLESTPGVETIYPDECCLD